MDYSFWIAIASLALSLFLLYIEIMRRRGKLYFSITSMDLVDGFDGKLFVVFYLSFINNSTIPKSIYRLDSKLLENYQIVEANGVPSSELNRREFRPFGSGCKGCVLRFDDIAEFPRDVEPLHSKTVALPVLISPVQFERYENSILSNKLIGYFVAFNYKNQVIAKAPIEFPV
jgi:hypothetical protein